MSLKEIQNEIIEEFKHVNDGVDKYEYLIDLGRSHPGLKNDWKDDDHAIPGCQSTVWLHSAIQGQRLRFWGDSDSLITRGIISLLVRVLDNRLPQEIAESNLYFIQEIGLSQQLSPSRQNGLAAIVREMQARGMALAKKSLSD